MQVAAVGLPPEAFGNRHVGRLCRLLAKYTKRIVASLLTEPSTVDEYERDHRCVAPVSELADQIA